MTSEQVGLRRLYDPRGCSLAGAEEIRVRFAVGQGMTVEAYLGPRPRFGITVQSGVISKYLVPGEPMNLTTIEFNQDASASSYPRHFFTEVACLLDVDIEAEQSRRFHSGEPGSEQPLLALVEQHREQLTGVLNLVAGVVGLRFHRQFVLEVITENPVALRGPDDYAHSIVGPPVEILEAITVTQDGQHLFADMLPAIGQAGGRTRDTAAAALSWLLRAWAEEDPVSKFIALFIPLEIILTNGNGLPPDIKEAAVQMRRIVSEHSGEHRDNLLALFDRLADGLRPSLAQRFEQLARGHAQGGWEADVEAFRLFNRSRNRLLHRGDPAVRLMVQVPTEEQVHALEDLVERYISLEFFNDAAVYQSRWRPTRKQQSHS